MRAKSVMRCRMVIKCQTAKFMSLLFPGERGEKHMGIDPIHQDYSCNGMGQVSLRKIQNSTKSWFYYKLMMMRMLCFYSFLRRKLINGHHIKLESFAGFCREKTKTIIGYSSKFSFFTIEMSQKRSIKRLIKLPHKTLSHTDTGMMIYGLQL